MRVGSTRGGRRAWGLTLAMFVAAAACSDSTLPGDADQAVRSGAVTAPPAGGQVPDDEPILGEQPAAGSTGTVAAGSTSDAGGQPGTAAPSGGGAGGDGQAAASGGSTIGVTKDTIAISASGIWTGPYAAITNKQFDNGFMTWVNEVNARGGIHGRKIAVKKVDNQTTAEGAVAACKEEMTNGTFMVAGLASYAAEVDCLDRAGVPVLALGSDDDPESWRVVRAVESRPSIGTAVATFAKSKLGAGDKKVGLMHLNLGLSIASADRFAATARKLGLRIVATERVEPNQGSFVAELSRLRSAGAEVVVLFVLTEILGVLRDAKAIGYQPTFTGATFAADDLSQVARNLMEGIMALRAYSASDSPGFKAFKAEATRQGRRNVTTTDSRHYGMGRVIGHVLEAAGPNLTRESFIAAADRTRGFDSGTIQPVSWIPPDPIGSRAHFPVICCNPDNTWKGLGPPQERF